MATKSFTNDFIFSSRNNINILKNVMKSDESGYFETSIKDIEKLERESESKVFKTLNLIHK